ncbi:MAG: potassium-transporting ATPase subunit KdpC [Gammaproteobacteria bacterium]|nr:potassium-transporting ATPase subunit KdpC [Gammaproteobacteria bacterium]
MWSHVKSGFAMLVVFTVLTGLVYPALVTGLAQVFFPRQANGSMVLRGGKPAGSSLIGQPFSDPKYFWGRLSATTPYPYNAASSGGSNLGPTNPALVAEVTARIQALHAADPGNTAPVPVDLVTSSGSGLDPDISPAAAYYQAARVARARHLDVSRVRRLISLHITGRQFGVLGEPRVNVLEMNLALDALH